MIDGGANKAKNAICDNKFAFHDKSIDCNEIKCYVKIIGSLRQ